MYSHQQRPSGTPLPRSYAMNGYGSAPYAKGPAKKKLEPTMRYRDSMQVFFTLAALLFAGMLCIVPVWNAFSLAQDHTFVFWLGLGSPHTMILSCVALLLLFMLMVNGFMRCAKEDLQNSLSILILGSLFITMLGLLCIVWGRLLSSQAEEMAHTLLHHCDYSHETHRLYEYSQVLHNIRAEPACAKLPSITRCEGYEPAPPYTTYLQYMEQELKCSGFCYRKLQATANSTKPQAAANGTQAAASSAKKASPYPPTLFSVANHQATCEGMASRHLANFAADTGSQTYYQGLYLVLVGSVIGIIRMGDACCGAGEETYIPHHS